MDPNSGPADLHNFFKIKPCGVHQWIQNLIIPQFDPKIRSLGLLEAKINPKLRVTGIYCNSCYFVVVVVVSWGGRSVLVVGGGSVYCY